ncbi:hypothetical protein CDAR_502011 [Caerostris darwini]|uniref:Uncharacterized protein n=1 Tax=Caerostris darwini TaxID=1538125 RepID=A0AAV4PQV6_9ARAC|nr:hypothetical protein CDAR_502011 [Caerostris darwini]
MIVKKEGLESMNAQPLCLMWENAVGQSNYRSKALFRIYLEFKAEEIKEVYYDKNKVLMSLPESSNPKTNSEHFCALQIVAGVNLEPNQFLLAILMVSFTTENKLRLA